MNGINATPAGLWSGMLWLTRPGDRAEARVGDAVAYAEGKYARPVRFIAHPAAEAYPNEWRGIPLRADRRVLTNHLFLVLDAAPEVISQSEGFGDV